MSLAVWLPLNGSLENQGFLAINGTNYNSTVSTSGKIGSCYSFNGSNCRIEYIHDKTIWNNKEISIALWYKYQEGNTTSVIVDIAADLCVSYTYSSSGLKFNYWRAYSNNGTRAGDSGSTTQYFDASQWHHVVATFDHNINKLYVDGILADTFDRSNKYTTNFTPLLAASYNKVTIGKSAGSNPYASGLINDVRIYDHALSPLEVKEISQGLVLHYKLDGNGMGNPNLLANSKLDGSWAYPSSSYSDKYSPITTSIPSASQYTLSFEAKSTVNGDKIRTHYYSPNTTTTCVSNQGVSKSASDGNMDFTLTTNWKKYWVIYSQNETTAVKHVICPRLVSGQGTGTISVRNVKLEEGAVATPWCPNEADELYKTMGLNDGIIYDSSGYNNNGTIVGTATTSSDTARYFSATAMNATGTTNHIECKNVLPSTIQTISCWIKNNGSTNYVAFVEPSSGLMFAPVGNMAVIKLTTANSTGYAISSPYYVNGEWNHIVVQKDGNTYKLWTNGIQRGSSGSNYYLHNGDKLYLFNRNYNANYASNCIISDFRAYCTLLSEADIKLLYSAGARADNLGGLHVQEFEEGARKGITTQRILHSSNFYESGYLELLHYDKNVYTEPDDTTWVRIFHHNDPTNNGLFASTDSFETSVYKNEHKWYDIEPLMANMPMYEFLVVQKTTSSATETKYRWIQNVNPLEATWADVKPGAITVNTSSGYTSNSMGGLYKNIRNNARLSIANTNSQNWFGALGSWTSYQNGVPGFPETTITTGYIDLYVRIYTPIKFIKDTGTNALNFIEV